MSEMGFDRSVKNLKPIFTMTHAPRLKKGRQLPRVQNKPYIYLAPEGPQGQTMSSPTKVTRALIDEADGIPAHWRKLAA